MKDPLRIIEMGKVQDFKDTFERPELFVNDVFRDNIGIFNGTLLHAAVYNRKPTFVEYFIGLGADMESKEGMGHTPLYEAILARSVKIAQILVDAGANIHTKNRLNQGLLAALCSMRYGDRSMTKIKLLDFLLGLGLDVNERNEKGRTILFDFVCWNEPKLLKILLDFGCQVDIRDNYGYEALHVAAGSGWVEVCSTLIEKGADKNASNKAGWTTLDMAILNEQLEVITYLGKEGVAISQSPSLKLLRAVLKTNEKKALALLPSIADLNVYNENGFSLLFLAIRGQLSTLVKAILERKNIDTEGAVSMAAFKKDHQSLELLLAYGASVKTSGQSPIYSVLEFGKVDEDTIKCIALLLEYGAVYNPDEANFMGRLGDFVAKVNHAELNRLLQV